MSSWSPKDDVGGAERAFWDAFGRLRVGKPKVLPTQTPVTQNNVAREAGKDPSALKKARFPTLVRTIQLWIETQPQAKRSPSPREQAESARSRSRDLVARNQQLKQDRDLLHSQLIAAQLELSELYREVVGLRSRANKNVARLPVGRK